MPKTSPQTSASQAPKPQIPASQPRSSTAMLQTTAVPQATRQRRSVVLLMTAVLTAAALLIAACGSDDDTDSAEVQTSTETTAAADTTTAEETPAAAETPSDGVATSDGATTTQELPAGTESATASADAGNPQGALFDPATGDAASLLALATAQTQGSVRGVVSLAQGPGSELPANFQATAAGDVAARMELAAGINPEFPDGAVAEIRYVGDSVYVRPPLPPTVAAQFGSSEVWYRSEPGGDSLTEALPASSITCVIAIVAEAAPDECDPLGEVTRLLVAASQPEIIGREEIGGVASNKVRFTLPFMDAFDEALGQETEGMPSLPEGDFDTGGSQGLPSDDFGSDGFGGFFDMLDAGLEVDAWIDDFGLVRRLSYDLNDMFSNLGIPETETAGFGISAEFFDYGADDISVTAPTSEQLVERGRMEDFFLN